ncbi:MAG: AAA family ATPase [Bacteroidota bacterium]
MITSIRLKNFKAFKDELFELTPLTLMTGMNGLGKSSVLQALLLFRQSYRAKIYPETGLAQRPSICQ